MFQFYPTPANLAKKALGLFQSKEYRRILEPSAGRGDLLAPLILNQSFNMKKIDCVEIDLGNQAILRSKGLNVVDQDFLTFSGESLYSHILMNPPFQKGDDHLIKAFNLLVDGELVAILNAETIKNPHTAKRALIRSWIEEYGSVEFVEEAFLDPDTQRKTSVEIALVHLQKKIESKQIFNFDLDIDEGEKLDYTEKNELALRGNVIANLVKVFNAAVASLKASETAKEEAMHYENLLEKPVRQLYNKKAGEPIENIRVRFNDGYESLKNKAWTCVLNSTDFRKFLTSGGYKLLMSEFERVSKLSFTEANIRGFLCGIIDNQDTLNMQMLLDCFDLITKYHPENRAYYKGWKSNEKHRELSYRVKMTRFIIPTDRSHSYGIGWEDLRNLEDFDKAFAMLDGKPKREYGLHELFAKMPEDLKNGERIETNYFDVRWYGIARTIHFYPKNKKLIEQLNILVGRNRKWLPDEKHSGTRDFWKNYEMAEKVTNAMNPPKNRWCEDYAEKLDDAHTEACKKVGINTSNFLLTKEGDKAITQLVSVG